MIRRAVVAHMSRNREHFAPFLEEDVLFEDYCELVSLQWFLIRFVC